MIVVACLAAEPDDAVMANFYARAFNAPQLIVESCCEDEEVTLERADYLGPIDAPGGWRHVFVCVR